LTAGLIVALATMAARAIRPGAGVAARETGISRDDWRVTRRGTDEAGMVSCGMADAGMCKDRDEADSPPMLMASCAASGRGLRPPEGVNDGGMARVGCDAFGMAVTPLRRPGQAASGWPI
jgi:hypothetical protein